MRGRQRSSIVATRQRSMMRFAFLCAPQFLHPHRSAFIYIDHTNELYSQLLSRFQSCSLMPALRGHGRARRIDSRGCTGNERRLTPRQRLQLLRCSFPPTYTRDNLINIACQTNRVREFLGFSYFYRHLLDFESTIREVSDS